MAFRTFWIRSPDAGRDVKTCTRCPKTIKERSCCDVGNSGVDLTSERMQSMHIQRPPCEGACLTRGHERDHPLAKTLLMALEREKVTLVSGWFRMPHRFFTRFHMFFTISDSHVVQGAFSPLEQRLAQLQRLCGVKPPQLQLDVAGNAYWGLLLGCCGDAVGTFGFRIGACWNMLELRGLK